MLEAEMAVTEVNLVFSWVTRITEMVLTVGRVIRFGCKIRGSRTPNFARYLLSITDHLRICYTEHAFFSDYNRRVLDFFNTYR